MISGAVARQSATASWAALHYVLTQTVGCSFLHRPATSDPAELTGPTRCAARPARPAPPRAGRRDPPRGGHSTVTGPHRWKASTPRQPAPPAPGWRGVEFRYQGL